MSQPPTRPPYPTEDGPPSFYQPSSHPLSPQPITGTPPPPPPKPSTNSAPSESPYQRGPPLPPPPPSASIPADQQYFPQTPHQHLSPNQPPPPSIEDHWLPSLLKDKRYLSLSFPLPLPIPSCPLQTPSLTSPSPSSKSDLNPLLNTPSLLTSLLHSPSTTHPSYPPSIHPLSSALATNTRAAQDLLALSSTLQSLRENLTAKLLQTRQLERAWRHKQSEVDQALEPWSPKALHARLVGGIAEQEGLVRGLEESFLEGPLGGGEGEKAGEREVAEWVKRFREADKVLGLRRERRARFEEGRVGGWR